DGRYQAKGSYQPSGDYATNSALNSGLNNKFDKSNVAQGIGTSTVHVMSQKASTDAFQPKGNYQPAGNYALVGASYTKAESDGRYQAKGSYAPAGSSYTKAESDGRYQGKGSYQPSGNYALVGASYTKAESDGKYQLKGSYQASGYSYSKAETDNKYQPKGNYAPAGNYGAKNTASKAQSGWWQCGDTGIIFQSIISTFKEWGEATVNFPKAFPNNCMNVVVSINSTTNSPGQYVVYVRSWTKSSVTVYVGGLKAGALNIMAMGY
ncbi:gp53-like domain-containing protein, partial [Proteus sp. G2661]|uniref:gp53-like domain-containing protein n=1 Tax=Proteus sp. G2661 TaxID=2698874 RepID=UPI003FA75E34